MESAEEKRRRLDLIEREIAKSEPCRSGGGQKQVFGSGDPSSGILLFGEGPGEEEERVGRPFVGASGRLLRKALNDLGFEAERDFFLLNVVSFRSFRLSSDGRRQNRPPTAEQIEGCRTFIEKEIEILEPRLVIAFGNTPAKWLLGSSFKMDRDHGSLFDWRGTEVFPTYHPGAAMRPFGAEGMRRKRSFYEDLDKVAKLVRKKHAA